MNGVNLQFADLPDGELGWASWNTITLDVDAAGHGWSLGRGGFAPPLIVANGLVDSLFLNMIAFN